MEIADNVAQSISEARPASKNWRSNVKIRRALDTITHGSAVGGGVAILALLVFVTVVLVFGASEAIEKFGFKFLINSDWNPVEGNFGALPVILGTFVASTLALLISVPVSIASAVFLTRIAPRWIVTPVSFMIELLAAIPSIAYGFWGVAVLIPFLQKTGAPFLKWLFGPIPFLSELFSGPSYGFSMLAAGIVLAIMVTPIITAVTREVLRTAPRELEEGAYALGATWWQATIVILGYGRMGIFGAIVLGFARAIGETMAVCMVIGNSNEFKASLFAPGQTMSSLLANEFREADKALYSSSLVYIAFVLLVLTVLLNGFARVLVSRSLQQQSKSPITPKAGETPATAVDTRPVSEASAVIAPRISTGISHYSRRARVLNQAVRAACASSAGACIIILGLILSYIGYMGVSSLNWDFFTKLPGPADQPSGMRNAIMGTLILIGLASTIGIPLGMLCGIYLSEYAKKNWFSSALRLGVDVLAGTPSIIIGVVAYELMVVPNGKFPGLKLGFSGWAGAFALAILMCPIIARTTEEMLKLVPRQYRESSWGLGGSHFQTIFKVVIPAASSGIITGIMLSVARIAGETAPLLFTALGNDQDVRDPSKPFPALTLKIFQYATSAEEDWIRQAWAGMLILILMILVLSAAVRYVSRDKFGVQV